MFRNFIRSFSTSKILYDNGKTKQMPLSVFGIEGRYVTALFRAASQMNQLEAVEKSLRDIQKELNKPTIKDFIESSFLSRTAKSKLLIDIGKAAGMPDAASNFLGIVAENGRLKKLRKMISLFLDVMVAYRKEASCEVITASPLADDDRKALMEALARFVKDKKVTLVERVDPKIIGGVIVGIEDKVIDMSIARKIMMYTDILKTSV